VVLNERDNNTFVAQPAYDPNQGNPYNGGYGAPIYYNYEATG
jgi:hypothetical protein